MRGRKMIDKAVRWRVFRRAIREARAAFAYVSPDELQEVIDQAVEEARARNRNPPS